jgi:hypothetical protein
MCNAWPAFSILDCLPELSEEMRPVAEWLMESQEDEGSWSLIPGEWTREPIVTGYAVSALQQFHKVWEKELASGNERVRQDLLRAEKAISRAVNYLLDVRPRPVKKDRLLLWPGTIRGDGRERLSLGTSALCMHVVAKWGRHREREELIQQVAETFSELVRAVNEGGQVEVRIKGRTLQLWDELHMFDGSVNYLWYFFAPISVVTLLRLMEHRQLVDWAGASEFVAVMTRWILDNEEVRDERSMGVNGGPTLSGPRVWATTQSAIVLSRVLQAENLLRLIEAEKLSGSPLGADGEASVGSGAAKRVFIGHGRSEAWLAVANFLRSHLKLEVVEFGTESRTSEHIVDILGDLLTQCDTAVLVLTSEDLTARGSGRARQNVIHEVGLFQGRLGFDRVVVVEQEGVEPFSNIAGLQTVRFKDGPKEAFYELGRFFEKLESSG